LRNAGLVSTTRGSGGGYKLERPPGQIRLSDVVEVFEGLRNRPTCLLGKGECSDADACSAHHAWKNVRKTYIEFLDANTLADIAPGAGAGKAAALTAIR
jgi:Rrf2 family iron-sulfur cluster assembly transcriptional regulator